MDSHITTTMTLLSPQEAGRKAQELAAERRRRRKKDPNQQQQQQQYQQQQQHMDTLLAHAGVDFVTTMHGNAAMAPPLSLATTYVRPADGPYKTGDSKYTRMDNPTRLLLEAEMARLDCYYHQSQRQHSTSASASASTVDESVDHDTVTEGATCCCCAFASGMMAVTAIILAHRLPLHVLLPLDTYHGVPTVLYDVFSKFHVTFEKINMTDMDNNNNNINDSALARALEDFETIPPETNVIVWLETPSNPQCHVLDVAAICQTVKQSKRRDKVTVVVDSTLAPPVLQQPLLLGADVVLHSATKYLAGHSDALLGTVTVSPWTTKGRFLAPALRMVQVQTGGVASPLDCWLTLRGLRTLSVRVEKQCASALTLATYLEEQRLCGRYGRFIKRIYYPGLTTSSQQSQQQQQRQYEIAKRQMQRGMFGGVFSMEMKTQAMAMALAGAFDTIQRATSLGGTETLIEHRASIEPPGRVVSPAGLLRVSVGLEHVADLLADFETALQIVQELFGNENENADDTDTFTTDVI